MNEQLLVSAATTGLPVVVRLAAIAFTMPVVASRTVPVRVRMAFVVALAILIVPSAMEYSVSQPVTPAAFVVGLVNEALMGALMGLSLAVFLAGVQLTGSMIEGLSGFSLSVFGSVPDQESGSGPLSRLFWWTTIAVFVAVGGVGQVMGTLLDSFSAIPPGHATLDRSWLDFMVQSISQGFEFGLVAALPAIAALLVASIVLGMAQRNFPQLGGMQVGLSLNAAFGMVVTSVALISAPWIINNGFDVVIEQLQDLFQAVAMTG